MAAYAALVSLMNDLELIPNHPTHSFSFDNKQLTSLFQTVHFLIDFMETYDFIHSESNHITRETTEVLESRIASAAHAAHDVIESHVVDQIHAGFTLGGEVKSYFLLDLQKAIDIIDYVKGEAMQFHAKIGLKAEEPTHSAPTLSESLTSEKTVMVGFDAVADRLMEMLTVTGQPSSRRVIPIVGMAGIGKTALAQNVYDHLHMQHHFDVRLWATISQEHSLENILNELLFGERKSTTGGNVSELGEKLHKKLWGRRYLIVLDDMWSVEAWDEIHMFLPDNGNGSCVIVTTRLSNLATYLSYSPFEINFLDDDKSWQLFCAKAFGGEDCPIELEEIGKKIVNRCRGLPLSIIVTGGHLRRSSRAIEYWEKVSNYMNPISILGADDQCLKIISLSYDHLPACLKPCFLYTGIFEEDEWIDASELLKFWVAEGFLKPKEGLCLEEVAEDYLNDLIGRNLIIVRERRWNGIVRYCGIHDMVRELCLNVGKKDKFMCVLEDTTKGLGRERCIVIPEGKLNSDIVVGALKSAPLLRSVIQRRQRGQSYFDEFTLDSRLLRLSANVRFPAANFQQVNLRYLAFSCEKQTSMSLFTQRPYLPSSISLFWNMQTLIINNFGVRITAPYEIWQMTQLRHLDFVLVGLPDPVPSERSNQQGCIVLQNLQTLLGVVNLRLTDEVCKRIPNIKELSVRYDHLAGDYEASSYYCHHNLGSFNKLDFIRCEFAGKFKWRDTVLNLTFPSSLEQLCLWNSHLRWEEVTMMIKSLPHLGSLELYSVQGPEWDLVEEEFPNLKVLRIFRCDDLIYWNADSSHFPVLESLDIWSASKLNEIPFDIGEISTLRRIKLRGCSVSAAVSAVRILVEQYSLGNQDVQLHVGFDQMKEVERFQKMVQEEGLTSNSLCLYYRYDKIKAF